MAIEILPTTCTINSHVSNLADSVTLTIVERDTIMLFSPVGQAWRTMSPGDEFRVRLGLRDLGLDDYGLFEADEISTDFNENAWVTTISGRSSGARMLQETAAADPVYQPVAPTVDEMLVQEAKVLTSSIATRAGIGIAWRSDSYLAKGFKASASESCAAVISRLLEPLRQSQSRYAYAWLWEGALKVLQRQHSAIAGTLDCSLGIVTEMRQVKLPQVGAITVDGATYPMSLPPVEERVEGTEPVEESNSGTSVRIVESTPTHRVVEQSITENGQIRIVTRETEDQTYQDVTNDQGVWLGRVLIRSVIQTEKNPGQSNESVERKTITYGYDSQWRLVLQDEITEKYYADTNAWKRSVHKLTRWEQLTPTDIRQTTTEFYVNVADDGTMTETPKADFPKHEISPGTLQSSIREQPDQAHAWETNDYGQPTGEKKEQPTWQYTSDNCYYENGKLKYKIPAVSGGGSLSVSYSNSLLWGYEACTQIANDIAADSGATRYVIKLNWARPFLYRKGHRLTLTNLPGGAPDVTAMIVGMTVRFGLDEWVHEIEFEAYL